MDQFTKEGRKLRPRKTAATSGASFEKVEYSPRSEERNYGDNDHRRNFGDRRSSDNSRSFGENRGFNSERRSYGERSFGERKPYSERKPSFGGEHRSYNSERKPYGERSNFGERRSFGDGERRSFNKPYGDRKPSFGGEHRSYNSERKPYGERSNFGERRSFGDGERRSFNPERRSFNSEERQFNGEARSFHSEPRAFADGERPIRKTYSERNRRPAAGPMKPKKKFAKKPISPFGKDTYEGISRMIDRRPVVNERESDERYEFPIKDEIRLNKFIANSGVCSRREADTLIQAGVVTVNGEIITELGTKVNVVTDDIRFNGERLHGEEKVYIIMNKPKGYVTTASDPHADKTVIDLVKGCPARVYPVGRLDKNTTGVLMLTNDGEIAERLTHPSYDKKKIYQVALDKELKEEDYKSILEIGVTLSDGVEKADELEYIDANDKRKLGIEIHSGKNRIVRRLFETLGYTVKALDRVYFAGVTKKGLKRGEWRYLTEGESNILKMGAYI